MEIAEADGVTIIRIPSEVIPPTKIVEYGPEHLLAIGVDEIASSGGGNISYFNEEYYLFTLAEAVAAIQCLRKEHHA